MDLPLLHSTSELWAAAGVLARSGGFAAFAPAFGAETGSLKFRVALAVLLVLVMLPAALATASAADALTLNDELARLASELATGLLFGFAVRAVAMAVGLVSQLVEQQLGLGAMPSEGEDAAATALGRLHQLVVLTAFLLLGGHRLVIGGLLDASVAGGDATGLLDHAAGLIAGASWLAVRLAAPLVVALLAANLAVGLIGRLLPNYAAPSLALPAQLLFALVLVLLSLAPTATTAMNELARALTALGAR